MPTVAPGIAGTTRNSVVLGGQRIGVRRPRARAVDAGELELPSFAWAAGTDPSDTATMATIAAGVSVRRYASTLEKRPPREIAQSVSKSATSPNSRPRSITPKEPPSHPLVQQRTG